MQAAFFRLSYAYTFGNVAPGFNIKSRPLAHTEFLLSNQFETETVLLGRLVAKAMPHWSIPDVCHHENFVSFNYLMAFFVVFIGLP